MMRIDMKNGWTIDSDDRQFCLFQPKLTTDKEGKEIEQRYNVKYQATLESILKTYTQQRIRDSDAANWKEVSEDLKDIKKELKKITKAIYGE